MSSFYHTPWQDGVTEFKEADMNPPLAALDQAIDDLHGSKWYDFMGQYLGDVLNSNALLMQGVVSRYMKLMAGAPGSQLYVLTTPTDGPATFTLKRNGATIGTILVNPGHNRGAFTVSSDVAFYNSDLFELYGPNPADASLKDVSWNIILEREDIGVQTTTTTTTETTTTTTTTV